MAQKKSGSRADKAVSGSQKNTKPAAQKKQTTAPGPAIPVDWLIAFVSLVLFVLFLIIAINPEGVLLQAIRSFMMGMIGQVGFYFSIPALLYMFVIHIFGRKTKVRMRSICLLLFVFLCSCIHHLIQVMMNNAILETGIEVVVGLYKDGSLGNTGGVLCGGFVALVTLLLGNVLTLILCVLGAILTLLGAMQITIPGIIRAIQERPRQDWEDDDEDDFVEPAAVVVNHIANKQIEYKRRNRERRLAAQEQSAVWEAKLAAEPDQQGQSAPVQPQLTLPRQEVGSSRDNVLSQMDLDIDTPLGVAREATPAQPEEKKIRKVKPVRVIADEPEEPISRMPELDLNQLEEKKQKAPVHRKTAEAAPEKPEPAAKPGKVTAQEAAESAQEVAQEIAKGQAEQRPAYCFPPIDLLKQPGRPGSDGMDEMRENSRRLNETLASFKIDAHIINVTRGPSVTRYEVEQDKGVRLSKLTGCADDIALSLGASGVRIAAVTGKISVVGIEVPNRSVTTVSLREVIGSKEFAASRSKSSFSVGKDIGGSCIVGNIAKMPHMLIAGTTGSGKSVCMNSIIISLLYKAGPEDVKLIMVDPKMVELGIYNGIPHLLIPVVTDPKKAAGALQWAVTEMLRRYRLMSDAGVRDLESYNSIVAAEGEGQKLPQVVVIIDELADLMLVAAKEVEDSICRIAQMGRASGMHLIIATQRPSADVITGLMKANIPSRIAFSVASAMESRIILDTQGAEKLVGKGDMLYAPIGCGKPLRVQGCFVTDGEVEAVAAYVKDHYVADYDQGVLEEIERKAQQTGKGNKAAASEPEPNSEELEGDEMLPAAVDVILETGQASVSMLQRRLKLGYARAARIVDEMEEKGIVGPFQGSKPRAILITKEQWAERNGGGQMDFDDLDGAYSVPEDI